MVKDIGRHAFAEGLPGMAGEWCLSDRTLEPHSA